MVVNTDAMGEGLVGCSMVVVVITAVADVVGAFDPRGFAVYVLVEHSLLHVLVHYSPAL